MTVNCRGLLLCFKPAHTYAVLTAFFFLFVDFTHPLHCLSQIFSFALCESLLLQMFKDKRVAEIMSFKDTRWILPEEQKKKFSHLSFGSCSYKKDTRAPRWRGRDWFKGNVSLSSFLHKHMRARTGNLHAHSLTSNHSAETCAGGSGEEAKERVKSLT